MAIIKCPECGKEISDKSAACVHCGYPIVPSVTEEKEPVTSIPMGGDQKQKVSKKFNPGNIVNLCTILGVVICFALMITNETGWTIADEIVDRAYMCWLINWGVNAALFILGIIIWIRKKPSIVLSFVYFAAALLSFVVYMALNWEFCILSHGAGLYFMVPNIVQIIAGIFYVKPYAKPVNIFPIGGAAVVISVFLVAVPLLWAEPFFVGEYKVVSSSTRWFFDAPDPTNGYEFELEGDNSVNPDKISLTMENGKCYFEYYGETYTGTFEKYKKINYEDGFTGTKLAFDKEPPTVEDFYLTDYNGNPSLDDCTIYISDDGEVTVRLIAVNHTITSDPVFVWNDFKFKKIE